MKVLFCIHGSICEIGVARAFSQNGLDIISFRDKVNCLDTDPEFEDSLSAAVEANKPDCVFSINFIPAISKACHRFNNVKYLCWIVDSPVLPLYYTNAVNLPNNYIFIFDRTQYNEFKPKCTSNMFYFPLGYDDVLFESITPSEYDHQKYDCDVSFVGSLYSEKCPYNGIQDKLPEYLRGYFSAILEAQSRLYGCNILKDVMSPEIVSSLNSLINISGNPDYEIDAKTMIYNLFLNPKSTELERIRLLNSIAVNHTVDLYTASDISPLKGVTCHPVATTLEGMPRVFKCSKINLNITAKGIQSGASLRVYDILGCGGFLLSNYQEELAEQFIEGVEIAMFYNEQDLLDKIDYYLSHDEERKSIARNGYNKVREIFTYTKRVNLMLKSANLC